MSYAIKLNGYFYSGVNHNGAVYCSEVSHAVHFYNRKFAENIVEKFGGEIVLVPMWAM